MNISQNTKITVGLGGVLALFIGGWQARSYFDDFRTELKADFSVLARSIEANNRALNARIDVNAESIRAATSDRFTGTDAERWAARIERANRDLARHDGTFGLIVPEPLPTRGQTN